MAKKNLQNYVQIFWGNEGFKWIGRQLTSTPLVSLIGSPMKRIPSIDVQQIGRIIIIIILEWDYIENSKEKERKKKERMIASYSTLIMQGSKDMISGEFLINSSTL